jgi:hypothetical protein
MSGRADAIHSRVRILRWVARVWSLLVVGFALLRVVTPDPYVTEPVPAEDWFLLSLWGVAILGLLFALRWELAGASITIGTMLVRELAWVVLKGSWFPAFLLVWLMVVPPAALCLVASGSERKARKTSTSAG